MGEVVRLALCARSGRRVAMGRMAELVRQDRPELDAPEAWVKSDRVREGIVLAPAASRGDVFHPHAHALSHDLQVHPGRLPGGTDGLRVVLQIVHADAVHPAFFRYERGDLLRHRI